MAMFEIGNPIIKDEAALAEHFIPERLLHREGERDYLAACLRPVMAGQSPRNVFLFGPPGTGKTSLIKWMFCELESHTSNARTFYVNCWQSRTTHAVLFEIASKLSKFINPRRQTKELASDIESLTKTGKKLIIALDEVDKLESRDILYDFSRQGYGIVLISNDEYALSGIDLRIRSSLEIEPLQFAKYTPGELADILLDRIEFALFPSKITKELVKLAAAAAGGDARTGLQIIRSAAKLAEAKNAEKIEKEDILSAAKRAKRAKAEQMLADLNPHELALYRIVEKRESIGAGELFGEYKKSVPDAASERSFRYYLEGLAKAGLIEAEGDVRWRKYSIKA